MASKKTRTKKSGRLAKDAAPPGEGAEASEQSPGQEALPPGFMQALTGVAVLHLVEVAACFELGEQNPRGARPDMLAITMLKDVCLRIMQHRNAVELDRKRGQMVAQAEDLADVYRQYQDGALRSRSDLAKALHEYFRRFRIELSRGQVESIAPSREAISAKDGPVGYAQYALGKFNEYHPRSLEIWKSQARTMSPPVAFGLRLDNQGILTYVKRHLARRAHIEFLTEIEMIVARMAVLTDVHQAIKKDRSERSPPPDATAAGAQIEVGASASDAGTGSVGRNAAGSGDGDKDSP